MLDNSIYGEDRKFLNHGTFFNKQFAFKIFTFAKKTFGSGLKKHISGQTPIKSALVNYCLRLRRITKKFKT